MMPMILSGLQLRSVVAVEDTGLGIVPSNSSPAQSTLASSPSSTHILLAGPAAHGPQRLQKLFLLAGPPHRSNAQTRFLSPRGRTLRCCIPADKASIFRVLSPPRSAPGTPARPGSSVDLRPTQLSDVYGGRSARHLAAAFLPGQKNLTGNDHVELTVVVVLFVFRITFILYGGH